MKTAIVLIKSEYKKAYTGKLIIIFILVFLLLDCVNTYRNDYLFKSREYMNIGRYELITQLEGELTEDKLAQISDKAELSKELTASGGYSKEYDKDKYYSGYEYGDAQLWIELSEKASALKEYSQKANEIALAAKQKGAELDDEYYIRSNKQIADRFSGREITALYNTDGFSHAFGVRFSSVLMIFLLMIGTCLSFTADRETGMSEQISISVKGGVQTSAAKIAAMMIFAFFISAVFFCCDMAMLFICTRPNGFSQPIYAVQGFEGSAFGMPIWCALFLIYILRTVSMCTLGAVFLLLAKLSRNTFSAFAKIVLFTVICAVVSLMLTSQTGKAICCLDPITLLQPKRLFEGFNVVRIFSQPVLLLHAALLGNALLFVIANTLNLLTDRRRNEAVKT